LRYVYVREINRLAGRLGSKVRLIAFDRGGMQNCLLIRRIDAKAVRNAQNSTCAAGRVPLV